MEHLRGATMSERVHKAMEYWLETIKYVQECRKKEIEYANMRRKENPDFIPINDDKREYKISCRKIYVILNF